MGDIDQDIKFHATHFVVRSQRFMALQHELPDFFVSTLVQEPGRVLRAFDLGDDVPGDELGLDQGRAGAGGVRIGGADRAALSRGGRASA